MIAFGGGAPLHACHLADKLGVRTIIVPKGAGVGSAIGFLRAPIAYEVTRSAIVSLDRFKSGPVNELLAHMAKEAASVVAPAVGKAKTKTRVIADCRYTGQGHEIRVEIPFRTLSEADGGKLKALFEKQYQQVYGLRIPNQEAEAMTWSVTVSSEKQKPARARKLTSSTRPKPRKSRSLYDPVGGRQVSVPVYWRFDLAPGSKLKGPAIIAEDETSTIVGTGFNARIDSLGYIVMERT
jgi:N-methylhydantoinase A